MKVLVTGSLGFIGSHLVDLLISRGHKVIGIDDLSGGKLDNRNKKLIQYIVDCRNFELVDKIFQRHKPEIVFHLAANAAENKAQFCPMDITSRNFNGSISVLAAAVKNGTRRFIFTSSIAIYGNLQTPFKETDKPEPEDLYGISKLAFENCLKIMSFVHGFEYVITRPHNVYGPRQNVTDPYRNVVTIFMNSILKGEKYNIYGDGKQKRCFSYIDDVVEAIYKCGFKKVSGMTFNIGSDKDYSVKDLSDIILKVAKSKIKPIHLPDRVQEVKIAISDHAQAKKYLNYKDSTSLSKGLSKTWKWIKKIGYQEPVYTEMEINSRLIPKNWRKND